jgi:hypothetical protein
LGSPLAQSPAVGAGLVVRARLSFQPSASGVPASLWRVLCSGAAPVRQVLPGGVGGSVCGVRSPFLVGGVCVSSSTVPRFAVGCRVPCAALAACACPLQWCPRLPLCGSLRASSGFGSPCCSSCSVPWRSPGRSSARPLGVCGLPVASSGCVSSASRSAVVGLRASMSSGLRSSGQLVRLLSLGLPVPGSFPVAPSSPAPYVRPCSCSLLPGFVFRRASSWLRRVHFSLQRSAFSLSRCIVRRELQKVNKYA